MYTIGVLLDFVNSSLTLVILSWIFSGLLGSLIFNIFIYFNRMPNSKKDWAETFHVFYSTSLMCAMMGPWTYLFLIVFVIGWIIIFMVCILPEKMLDKYLNSCPAN